jgi:signal transduction histidine kinase
MNYIKILTILFFIVSLWSTKIWDMIFIQAPIQEALPLFHIIKYIFFGAIFNFWSYLLCFLDELLQLLIKGRVYSNFDIAYNILGASFGIMIRIMWKKEG